MKKCIGILLILCCLGCGRILPGLPGDCNEDFCWTSNEEMAKINARAEVREKQISRLQKQLELKNTLLKEMVVHAEKSARERSLLKKDQLGCKAKVRKLKQKIIELENTK